MTQHVPGHLHVEDLIAYLRLTGWTRVKKEHPSLIEFRGPHDLCVVVPTRNDFIDTPLRMAEAIHLLSQIEEQPPDAVIQSILYTDRDVIRQRILRPTSSLQTLSLESASRIVQGLRNLIAYAACVEEDPKPYFPKATKMGRRYVEQCRFGHTFAGSFGFSIEVPVPTSGGLPGIEQVAPFERRVVERVARGFSIIKDGILGGNVESLVKQYEAGFNANMYEVMLSLAEPLEDMEYEFSVSWSPHWSVPSELKHTSPVRFGVKAQQYFETAAKELRKADESREQTIRGKVIQLRSESGGGDDFDDDSDTSEGEDRTITVLWHDPTGRQLRIRVPLGVNDYRRACDAHRDGLQVAVTGRIEKIGKFWQLMRPHDFHELDRSSQDS